MRTLFSATEKYLKDEQQRNQILSFFVYLWTTSDIEDGQFVKLIEQLPTEITKETMTTYEQILLRGEKRGEKRGKVENENLVIANAYAEGFREEIIAKLTGLSVEEVLKRFEALGLEK